MEISDRVPLLIASLFLTASAIFCFIAFMRSDFSCSFLAVLRERELGFGTGAYLRVGPTDKILLKY